MQAFLFFFLCPHQKLGVGGEGGSWSQAFLLETMETGDKNCDHFYCTQMNLAMKMWFIFADDWNNAQCLSRFSAMAKLFLHARNHT